MNYLTLLTLFPKKINVTLIDATSNQVISKHKIPKDDLPEVFNRPTMLNIDGENWQVIKADPVSGDEFYYTKRITLVVQKKTDFDKLNSWSLLPTVSDVWPAVTDSYAVSFIQPSQWLQLQFLPVSMMPIIESELSEINAILNKENTLNGYEQIHIRKNIALQTLLIPKTSFFNLANNGSKGLMGINSIGTISNSFTINTGNHSYYGILDNDAITCLCLREFDYVDDEFALLSEKFRLVLVDWCNGIIVGA